MSNFTTLADTAVQLMDLETQGEAIYRYIGDTIREMSGAYLVIVSTIEPGYISKSRYIAGLGKRLEEVTKILGFDPHTSRTQLPKDTYEFLSSGEFIPFNSVYELSLKTIPKAICDALELLMRIGEIYQVAIKRKGKVSGGAVLIFKKGHSFLNRELTASFIQQAAIALQNKHAEDKLLKSEQHYRDLFENAMFGMYQSNLAGEISLANKAFFSMFGYDTANRVEGLKTADLHYDPASRKDWSEKLEQTGAIDQFEWAGRTQTGEKIYLLESAKKVPATEERDAYYEGVITDITQQKQLLHQMEEIAEVQSHKIRGPVASILGLIELMMQEKDTTLKHQYLEQLKLSADQLDSVIHEVVNLTQEMRKK
ncbi:MAG TPA: hypothetical protein DCE41_33670 [Cytophagales bacterium]|nr:hypothetical protein [Cytophagales bacterium]HAA18670.1 hypothetical protein [Cytophagales bacterium]HAP58080.1 hypothetical protein [Cytophagales bacterium]